MAEREAELHMFFTDNKNPNLDCYRNIYMKKIPVMFYNNYYKELKYPRVINNDYKCARTLLSMLLKAGHKHIAGIFVYDNYQSIEKFRGYVGALRNTETGFVDDYVKWCVSNEAHTEGFYKDVGKFLKGIPKCTAIVCYNYMILQAVLKYMNTAGKTTPEDYSLVCFDYSGSFGVPKPNHFRTKIYF